MSDRNFTTIETTGPNAAAARRAVIKAIKAEPVDEYGYNCCGGSWFDEDDDYFDHNSGKGAVIIAGQVSHDFPEVTFKLNVSGGFADNLQGTVIIKDGKVADGRSGFVSYGDPQQPLCEKCFPNAFKPEDLLTIDKNVPEGQVTCHQCGTVYRYTNCGAKRKWGSELVDTLGWFALYEIPRAAAMTLAEKIRWHFRLYSRPLRNFIRSAKDTWKEWQWERQRRQRKLKSDNDISMADVLRPGSN